MCILLSLSETKLLLTAFCKVLTECIGDMLLLESDCLVRDCLIVILETYISCLDEWTIKACKLIITECTGNLTCTVRTEVKEDDRIILFYNRNRLAIFHDNGWKNELIGYILCIRISHCLNSVLSKHTLSLCQRIISLLYTIPVVVTIHRIVTSRQRSDLTNANFIHLILKLLYIILTRCWRSITTI